jgi:hypothetical protein
MSIRGQTKRKAIDDNVRQREVSPRLSNSFADAHAASQAAHSGEEADVSIRQDACPASSSRCSPRLPPHPSVTVALKSSDTLVEASRSVAFSKVFDDHFRYLGLPMAKTLYESMSDRTSSQIVSLTATATLLRSLHRTDDARRAVLAARGVAMGCFDEMSRESGVAMAVLGVYYTCNPPPPLASLTWQWRIRTARTTTSTWRSRL